LEEIQERYRGDTADAGGDIVTPGGDDTSRIVRPLSGTARNLRWHFSGLQPRELADLGARCAPRDGTDAVMLSHVRPMESMASMEPDGKAMGKSV